VLSWKSVSIKFHENLIRLFKSYKRFITLKRVSGVRKIGTYLVLPVNASIAAESDTSYVTSIRFYPSKLAYTTLCKTRQHALIFPPAYSPSPTGGTQWYRLLLCAAYGLRRRPYCALSMGMTQQSFVFCPWWPWPLTLTFELGRDFCTVYLTAKFDRPTFSRSEVIVRTNILTNKQTDAAENIHRAPLCYAGE